jgi:hypothetical protein
MGIKGFQQWLRTAFPKSFIPVAHVNHCDFLYVDYNSFLHCFSRLTGQGARNESFFMSSIQRSLKRIFFYNQTKELGMLAIDGPASISKIPLQLQRRARSMPRNSKSDFLSMPLPNAAFTAALLTPGTLLMQRTEETIIRSIHRFLEGSTGSNARQKRFSIVLSGHATCGEAEDKIMQNIHRHENNSKTKFTILSSDGDAIVQALAASPMNLDVVNGNANSLDGLYYRFSKSAFVKELESQLINACCAERVINDFIFLCLLCGNDYLNAVVHGHVKSTWPAYLHLRNTGAIGKNEFFVNVIKDGVVFNAKLFSKFCILFASSTGYVQDNMENSLEITLEQSEIRAHFLKSACLSMWKILIERKFNGHEQLFSSLSNATISIFDFQSFDTEELTFIFSKKTKETDSLLLKYPSISAIMLLSINSEWKQSIPAPLRGIFSDYMNKKFSPNLNEAHKQLEQQINQIPRSTLSKTEKLTMYPRGPTAFFIKSTTN